MKSRKNFKEDIKRTFVIYALLPISLITLSIYATVFVIWQTMIISETINKNTYMQQQLRSSMTVLINGMTRLTQDSHFFKLLQNPLTKSKAYEQLYDCTNQVQQDVDFYIFNEHFEMIGGNKKEFPDFLSYHQGISWGITKRMKDFKDEIILECQKVTNEEFDRKRLLMGQAIVEQKRVIGYIVFVMDGEEFVKGLRNPTTQVLVTDEYDQIFLATLPGFENLQNKIQEEFKGEEHYIAINHERYYKQKTSILDGKLKIYTFTSIGKLMDVLLGIGLFFLIGIIGVALTMVLIAKKIAKEKTKIIDQLVEVFKQVQKGNLDVKVELDSYDEFKIIGDACQIMLESIKELIRMNEEETKQNALSEIKQLESQFNPHFLFNTLENIRYMIQLNPKEASQTIVSLSTLLRYSISNTMVNVTIAQDMEYTESYLRIQQYRFSNRLFYSTYREKGTENCRVPKLILQPIIENAIKYGFGNKDTLTIQIKVSFLADDLVIVIYDDGVGMEPDVLQNLRDLLKQRENTTDHIGVYNVHRRIQLMYGDNYGLKIKSEVGEGTVVRIILPIHKGEK